MATKKKNNRNALLFAAVTITTVYFIQQKSSSDAPPSPPPPSSIPPILTPTGGEGLTVAGNGQRQSPFNAPGRAHWAARYKALYQSVGKPNASDVVWTEFQGSSNPFKDKFPTKASLILNLATYTPNELGRVGQLNIQADDTPVYDTWSNWWNGIPHWECEDWIQWYDANALKYGSATAKSKFVDAWSFADNWGAGGSGHWCGDTCDFVNYFRNKGIDVANFGVETVCNLISIPSNLVDATAAVTQTAANTAKTLNWLIPTALVTATGIYLYNQAQN